MSANLEKKKKIVAQLVTRFDDAQSLVLVEYQGLTNKSDGVSANVMHACRGVARQHQVGLKITKNTLVKQSLKNSDKFSLLLDDMTGPLMYLTAPSNEVLNVCKVAVKINKMSDSLVIKSGMLDDKYLTRDEVVSMANIPSKEVLLSMLLSAILQNIVKFVRVVDAVKEKKQSV